MTYEELKRLERTRQRMANGDYWAGDMHFLLTIIDEHVLISRTDARQITVAPRRPHVESDCDVAASVQGAIATTYEDT